MVWAVNLVTDHFAGLASTLVLPLERTGTVAIATLVWITPNGGALYKVD
jgi:hypothetical protein